MYKLLPTFLICIGLVSAALAQIPTGNQPYNAPTKVIRVVIAAGNTFQTVLLAVADPTGNPLSRHSLTIQNNNTTDSCWLDYGLLSGTPITAGTATKAGAILLLPGGSYTRYFPYIPSDEIEVTCTTTSDTMRVEIQ